MRDVAADSSGFRNFVQVAEASSHLPVALNLRHRGAKIGDSLLSVPWALNIAKLCGRPVHLDGAFSSAVFPLFTQLPLICEPPQNFKPQLNFSAVIQEVFDYAWKNNCHMLESYFYLSGMADQLPVLPIALPLTREASDIKGGAVISPFSGSDSEEHHKKTWWADRWIEVIKYILNTGIAPAVYVLGSKSDNMEPYLLDGVSEIRNSSLPKVLDILDHCRIFLSVDNGISHLAHFGATKCCVQILPQVLPSNMVVNPRAVSIRDHPKNISVASVISAIDKCLGRA